MSSDRYIFTPSPHWNLHCYAADLVREDSPNLAYHDAVTRSLTDMSLQQLASLHLWSPPAKAHLRLLDRKIETHRPKQSTSLFENTDILKILDMPDIRQTIPTSRLIAPLYSNQYVLAGEVTQPFCLTMTPTSSEVQDIYPKFPNPISHIAVASPNAKAIFVADTAGELYLSHPGLYTRKIIRSSDGFTDITPISQTEFYATSPTQVYSFGMRERRSLTQVCCSVKERFFRTFAKNDFVFVVSDEGVKKFDARQPNTPICVLSLLGITAAAQKGGSIFFSTETDKSFLAEYNLDLACTSRKRLGGRIKDILCPCFDNIIITLQDRPAITIWKHGHSLRPIQAFPSEFQESAHGAISCDSTSLAIVSRERECVGLWDLTQGTRK